MRTEQTILIIITIAMIGYFICLLISVEHEKMNDNIICKKMGFNYSEKTWDEEEGYVTCIKKTIKEHNYINEKVMVKSN